MLFRSKEADAAFALCEQALAIDPNNVRALMALGIKFLAPVLLGLSGDPKGDVERADELESKALALDPDHAWARDQKGWVLLARGRNDEAVAEFDRALRRLNSFARQSRSIRTTSRGRIRSLWRRSP